MAEHIGIPEFKIRGEPATIDYSVAIAMSGDLQVELIEQHSPGRTPYSEFLSDFGEGLQHIAYYTNDFDAASERASRAGLEILLSGKVSGRVQYYDTGGHAGSVVELSELTPWKQAFFDSIAEIARTWDGADPVRPFKIGDVPRSATSGRGLESADIAND
jgi:hypothetical protein